MPNLNENNSEMIMNNNKNMNNSIGSVNNITKNINFENQFIPQINPQFQFNAYHQFIHAQNNFYTSNQVNFQSFKPLNNMPKYAIEKNFISKNQLFQTLCVPINNPLASMNLQQNHSLMHMQKQLNPNLAYNNNPPYNKSYNSISSNDKSPNNTINNLNNNSCIKAKNTEINNNNLATENNSTNNNTYRSSYNYPQSFNTFSNNFMTPNLIGVNNLNLNKINFIDNTSNICQSIYLNNNSLNSFSSSKKVNSNVNNSINNNSNNFSIKNQGKNL
jgi:hypothetical protein